MTPSCEIVVQTKGIKARMEGQICKNKTVYASHLFLLRRDGSEGRFCIQRATTGNGLLGAFYWDRWSRMLLRFEKMEKVKRWNGKGGSKTF